MEGDAEELLAQSVAICDCLRALPKDSVVVWGDDGKLEEGKLWSWVDVLVPGIQEAVGIEWVWTVVDPDDEAVGGEDPTVIGLPTEDGGWTPDEVSRVLEYWTLRHAGCCLVFQFDRALTSTNLALARARLAKGPECFADRRTFAHYRAELEEDDGHPD